MSPSKQIWYDLQKQYGEPFSAGLAWRCCRMLSPDRVVADRVYEEVEGSIKTLFRHYHALTRYQWAGNIIAAIRGALPGCLSPDSADVWRDPQAAAIREIDDKLRLTKGDSPSRRLLFLELMREFDIPVSALLHIYQSKQNSL